MLAAAATFVLCLAIILSIYWMFVVRQEMRAGRILLRRLAAEPHRPAVATSLAKKVTPLSALKFLDELLGRSGHFLDPMQRSIRLSGLPITPGTVLLASAFVAIVVYLGLVVLTSEVWLGVLGGSIVAVIPSFYVYWMVARRTRRLEEQFPQAVDLIAASLRAGHAFTTGLLVVAEEIEDPLGAEFRLIYDHQNFGKPLPEVMKEFANRVPLLDARIFATAVLTQRETGGNLAEVLDRMASLIRERFRLRRQVRALSAHGRITGLVLSALPTALAGILLIIAPAHMTPLFQDPFGIRLVAFAIVLQLLGILAVRHIVNIEY